MKSTTTPMTRHKSLLSARPVGMPDDSAMRVREAAIGKPDRCAAGDWGMTYGGSAVGVFVRKMGLRAFGVAGGPEKGRIAVAGLVFDACAKHRAADVEAELKAAPPDGTDIYFGRADGRVFRL